MMCTLLKIDYHSWKQYLNTQNNENKIIIYIQLVHDPLVHDMKRHKDNFFPSVLSRWKIMSSCQPGNCMKRKNSHNAIKMIFVIFSRHILFLCGWSSSMRSVLVILFQVATLVLNVLSLHHWLLPFDKSSFSLFLYTLIASLQSARYVTLHVL